LGWLGAVEMNENSFFINLVLQAFNAEQLALHFFVKLGWLSAFFVFAFNLKPESRRWSWLWILGGVSLVPPTLFFATNWTLTWFEFQPVPIIVADAQFWLGLWVGGVIMGVFWLRFITPRINASLARFKKTTVLERNRKSDVREIAKFLPQAAVDFNPVKFINFKKGILLGLDENRKPVYINLPHDSSVPHIQVVGTTGAGKGVSLCLMAAQFIERGESVFYCDPKNDEWAPHVLHHAAQRAGKPFHFVNLNRPNSAQFNPFLGATEEEIFELFQAGFSLTEKGDASDFYGIADRREAQTTAKLMASQNLNIAQAYAARREVLHDPKTGAEKFAGRLRELAETPSINAISAGVDLAKVIEEGGCVYFVGSMRNDIIKTVQRFSLVRLIQLAERRDRIAGGLRPVCIVLDEVKYHLSRPALEGLGAARDKGVHLVLAHQSLGDLRDCSKDLNPDAVVDAVVENCRIKICYRVMNPATAEWLAAMSGSIQVDDETRKVERNIAQAETVMGERAIRQAERFYIDVNMLLNLPPSVSVVYGDGLPKFVSIRPLTVSKTQEAVKINIVDGAAAPSGVDAIKIGDVQPPERYEISRAIALD
jgi:hypothetical protein